MGYPRLRVGHPSRPALDPPYCANIVKLIEEKLFCALITKEEDALLSKAGLRNKMPEGWSFETGDMLARYRVVGIKMHTF